MLSMGVIWLVGIVVFLVIEAVSYQIVSVWFALGAIGGLIAHICGADFYIQILVFIVLSAALLAALRPVSVRFFGKNRVRTNADSLIGKTVLITHEVNNVKETGQGRTGGMEWTVRSGDGEIIPQGATVKVLRIEGVKLIVESVQGGKENG